MEKIHNFWKVNMSANQNTEYIRYLYVDIWQYGGQHKLGKPLNKMLIDYSINTVCLLNFTAPISFWWFCRIFFIQITFMYEVGKCPKQRGSESLPLLRHCRDPFESKPSPTNIKFFKKNSETATLSSVKIPPWSYA